MEYRKDIDGLRAIAVWLVVLYHAGYDWFPGGFVGVDVFFVISGYLITGLIVFEREKGDFSYSRFYSRRIKRLVPAFLVVSCSSFVLALFYMLPNDLIHHSKMIALALLSLGNFYTANTTGGYFTSAVELIPLLHTWSLAVEEQFYLFWPVLLVFLIGRISRKRLLIVLTLIVILSLLFSEWFVSYDADRAYYLLPGRIFELLIGATLLLSWKTIQAPAPSVALLSGFIGLVLIVFAAVSLDQQRSFPGCNALWPCIGAALIIYSGRTKNKISTFLSLGPLVFFGLLSYSFYLWHWVIFSCARYITGELTWGLKLFLIAASVLLAAVTWVVVENPIRHRWKASARQTIVTLFILPLVIFIGAALVVDRFDGLESRISIKGPALEAFESKPAGLNSQCANEPEKLCGDVLLLGDSHAEHFGGFLKILTDDAGLSLEGRTNRFCLPLYGLIPVREQNRRSKSYKECQSLVVQSINEINSQEFVVLSGYWSSPVLHPDSRFFVLGAEEPRSLASSLKNIERTLEDTVRRILDKGAIPVIILDNFAPTNEMFRCSVRKVVSNIASDCDTPLEQLYIQQAWFRGLVSSMRFDFPELMVIDPNLVLCNDEVCLTALQGVPLYRDNDHLNGKGSIMLGERYLQTLGNPFSR